jgi:hypothetical protein
MRPTSRPRPNKKAAPQRATFISRGTTFARGRIAASTSAPANTGAARYRGQPTDVFPASPPGRGGNSRSAAVRRLPPIACSLEGREGNATGIPGVVTYQYATHRRLAQDGVLLSPRQRNGDEWQSRADIYL